ncbi:MAG TPA: beta-CASP ribonuclease aCPSF1 [Methanosarcinales archaeon]|nr:beta-CASP ribonuclease aCPSF1 [Methanosarcinales archaeon]
MSVEKVLSELKQKVRENLPKGVTISDVEFEGPELVIYTEEPRKFANNGEIVRSLAKDLRKRIVVRPDPKMLLNPAKAIKKINEIIPEDAGIKDHYFDPDTGEVIIEAEKPGIVIGKHGSMLREIAKNIGWTPKAARAPPIESFTVKQIRQFMRSKKDERKSILKNIGRRIHRTISLNAKWLRITMLGGCHEVGRSCYILSTPETRVLIDCGVNVGSEDNGTPYLYVPEAYPLNQIDAVIVTHAHLDHCGLVPLLFQYGYDGPVYCTPPTRDLMALLQTDYIDVAGKEGKTVPYKISMISETLKHTIALAYGEVTDIAPDIKLTFHNAGHILGSAISHFHIGDGLYNVVFTGDFKYEKTRLFDAAVNNFPRAEAVIMEATYGKEYQPPRKDAEFRLQQIVRQTIRKGGSVLIPTFAVGRSQEVMIVLEEAIQKGILKNIPIYLDGMIWEATAIHTTHPEYLNNDLRNLIFRKGTNPFLSECFVQVDSQKMRSNILSEQKPSVIIATSGMMNGGPIMEYLKVFGHDEKNTLIFVGYQAEGTTGRRIQKGWKEIPITVNRKTETIKINLKVETVDGFSGHSDRHQLIRYIRKMHPRPEIVLTNHGEDKNCIDLANTLSRRYKIDALAPRNLETVRLV